MPHPETEWLAGARRLDEKVLGEIYDVLSPALYLQWPQGLDSI